MARKKKTHTDADGVEAPQAEGAIAVWTQRARAWGLLIGFGVAFGMAYRAGMPVVDAALRGIVGAIVMSLILWWCTLMVIQGLIRTALVKRNEEREKAYAEILAAQEAAAAARAAQEEDDVLFGDDEGFPS